jgi:beta-carotene ketolase (CrtW type)
MPIQILLSTGMFITAHDAMHGTVAPRRRRLNDIIGSIALFLYAAFPFQTTKGKHWQHHAAPVSGADPDYTSNPDERFLFWLKDFAGQYYSWKNFLVMHLHIATFWMISGSLLKVVVFFAVPAWVSALQLFYFGTYLPHRTPLRGHQDVHNAISSDYPVWLSLLTCFHFGYHREHHHFPFVPWWRLPRIHAQMR